MCGSAFHAVIVCVVCLTSLRAADLAGYDRSADPHEFTVFMHNGGWCWFQDPRAIIHKDHLIIGSVQGSGSGPALIGVYDLVNQKPLGVVAAHDPFDRDDHNSPVFIPRSDGSVLAMYARHGREVVHYYRISQSADFLTWSDEHQIDHGPFLSATNDRVTYANLYRLRNENKLYCFFRGLHYNPCMTTSLDEGVTWESASHFIKSEIQGRHRPYVRYAGNGVDCIHLSFTDGHPRDFGNSIYYAAFRNQGFYRADGTFIKSLSEGGPLRPSEAERVFLGSGRTGKGRHGESASGSAWTSAIAYDAQGRPHIAYSYYISNDDHRYRLVSWDGTQWRDREVAYAGKCLYHNESSYTGLISLDPVDPRHVVISTDVHPSTGEATVRKHEIYRALIESQDDRTSITWQPVTSDSPVCNIRPYVLRDGRHRYVLWNRGDFRSYTDYQLDTVGYQEDVE